MIIVFFTLIVQFHSLILYITQKRLIECLSVLFFFRILLRCMTGSHGFKDMEDLNSLLRVIETDLATVEQKLASHRAAHPSPAKLMVRVCVEVCLIETKQLNLMLLAT